MKLILIKYTLLFLGLSFSIFSYGKDTLAITFSQPAGFYNGEVNIRIASTPTEAIIYYTLNGAKPTSNSYRYKEAIVLDTTKVLRAVAYHKGKKSKIITNTYFVNEDSTKLPIVSVSIPESQLFDPVRGLFVKGPRAANRFPFKGANYYSRREVPCFVEFFEADKEKVFEAPLGFKIFGGMSRIFPQKSFSLYASRSRYGVKHIKHRIFKEKKQKKYKRLVLRNSGSDYGETHFRDALITSFGREMGLPTQLYRPAVVYINGKYWGMYNIREKLTKHYIEENYGHDKDSIDLMEHRKDVNAGSRRHYNKMRSFMRKNSLASQENFDIVDSMMDVENFMEYQIIEIYIDNQDAGGNIKFWRPQTEGGKWRWILYDTDFGLGHYGREGYKNNSLAFHTKPNGPIWPNPPWSTLNLRSLLQNKEFQVRFVTRFLDRMNYTLDSNRIIRRIDKYTAKIKDEMPRHWKRWKIPSRRWYREIKRMKEFSRERPAYMRKFLKERFSWVGEEVELAVEIDSGGYVLLNEVIDIRSHFEGIYFQNLPIVMQPKPYFGHVFSHWEMNGEKIESEALSLRLDNKTNQVKAVFIRQDHPASKQMIINEISFGDDKSGDWVEFYNDTEEALDVSNWYIIDGDDNKFVFPQAQIAAKNYLVVCKEEELFKKAFPTCKNYIGGLSFGLSRKKDKVMLYDKEDRPVDSIGYKVKGDYKTIVLRDYNNDNNNIENWQSGLQAGSPASVNPEYLKIKQAADWQYFLELVKIGGITVAIFIAIMLAYLAAKKQFKRVDK